MEDERDNQIIFDRNKRIAEIDRILNDPDIRDTRKRELRSWRNLYREEIRVIINKNKR